MDSAVAKAHPTLWHYTTGLGLHGILRTGYLVATNILYLNDAHELVGFFDSRLGRIISGALASAEASRERSESLAKEFRRITLKLPMYVTSFCTPRHASSDDGVLSQWRGYGTDGGYAVVFDTARIGNLLQDEARGFAYLHLHIGDVDYVSDETTELVHEESRGWESTIKDIVARKLREPSYQPAADLVRPFMSLATRHKHAGFHEECEVRIAVVTPNSHKSGLPDKPVHFRERDGLLIPYIKLFDRDPGPNEKLPVMKVIVGPHPEREKRGRSIELLLKEVGIKAPVVVSEIPYLGR